MLLSKQHAHIVAADSARGSPLLAGSHTGARSPGSEQFGHPSSCVGCTMASFSGTLCVLLVSAALAQGAHQPQGPARARQVGSSELSCLCILYSCCWTLAGYTRSCWHPLEAGHFVAASLKCTTEVVPPGMQLRRTMERPSDTPTACTETRTYLEATSSREASLTPSLPTSILKSSATPPACSTSSTSTALAATGSPMTRRPTCALRRSCLLSPGLHTGVDSYMCC